MKFGSDVREHFKNFGHLVYLQNEWLSREQHYWLMMQSSIEFNFNSISAQFCSVADCWTLVGKDYGQFNLKKGISLSICFYWKNHLFFSFFVKGYIKASSKLKREHLAAIMRYFIFPQNLKFPISVGVQDLFNDVLFLVKKLTRSLRQKSPLPGMAGESFRMKDKHGPTQPVLMHSPNPLLIGNPLCNYTLKTTLYLAPIEPNAENMFVIMSLSNDGWLAEFGALAKCLFDLDSHSKHLSRFSFSLHPVCSFYLFVC